MKKIVLALWFLVLAVGCDQKIEIQPNYDFTLTTVDSVQIFGDEYMTSSDAPTIILFHQGGSNARGEYGSIIPRLVDEGFNVITVDQRRGGQTYGSYNRTVENIEINEYSYCDAYEDLTSTLDYVISNESLTGEVIVWGSSYSASLAIQLAAKNQDKISGALAFSPASGGPMASCKPDEYLEVLELPLLVLRPTGEMEIESVQRQFELVESFGHQTYVADPGVHGSSMLVQSRTGAEAGESWNTVLEFINSILNEQ
ncbi:MAG: alpha/beta hydrolase [Balneolaceae bacterium]|nr:alpha/beta hydrolase [Balneolaceae bacterium]MBO6547850.1 alpha/beta hydrolase [Balneolaceae bacterium]MBO6648363.1 alpha/beta hydrolase [Balneolaceae bacterium]